LLGCEGTTQLLDRRYRAVVLAQTFLGREAEHFRYQARVDRAALAGHSKEVYSLEPTFMP
jgi:hypothetical protein